MRIATDLQAAVTDGLTAIVREAQELPGRLAASEDAAARALLARIADRAREALADVRRVLGILRHDGPPPPLAPTQRAVGDDTAPPSVDQPARRPRSLPLADRGARRLDRALVTILLVGAALEMALAAPSGDRLIGALTAVPIVTPLLWRRRRPVTVAAAVLGAIAIQSTILGLDPFPVFDIAALVSASYAVGAHAERRLVVAGLLVVALGAALHAAVFHPDAVAPAVLGGATVPWSSGAPCAAAGCWPPSSTRRPRGWSTRARWRPRPR